MRRPVHVAIPTELRVNISAHGFWKQRTTTMFGIRIVNLYAGSYLHMMPAKALAEAEKGKKYLHLQTCLERRRYFTTMVYSTEIIPGVQSLVPHKRLAALISFKLKREYSELCGFLRVRMSLEIVRTNSLIIRIPWGD